MALLVVDAANSVQTVNTLPGLGQSTSAGSLPVVLASDQGALTVTFPSTLANTALQASQLVSLQAIQGALGQTLAVSISNTISIAASGTLPVSVIQSVGPTDRGGVIAATNSAQGFLSANAQRKGWEIQNQGSAPLFINFEATATLDNHSLMIPAGSYYNSTNLVSQTSATIIGTAGTAYYAREY